MVFVHARVWRPPPQAQVVLLPISPAAANLRNVQSLAAPLIIEILTILYMLSRKCSLAEMLFV